MPSDSVLIVDDDAEIRRLLTEYFERNGFRATAVADGRGMRAALKAAHPDIVILDIMLPGEDGLALCRDLRTGSNIPILMLTARDDEIDRVVGLEVGADDYLTKPFSMRELMARVKSQIRRARLLREEMGKAKDSNSPHEKLTFDNLTIDLTRREVILNDEPLQIKPKEYELLLFLAEHRRQMLSREFILERVWGWDFIGDSRTVDVHIRWLRQKIEADSSNPTRIVTVRGGGYRFEG